VLLLCITEAQNESIRVTDLKLVTAIHFRLCSPADRLLRAILACCFVRLFSLLQHCCDNGVGLEGKRTTAGKAVFTLGSPHFLSLSLMPRQWLWARKGEGRKAVNKMSPELEKTEIAAREKGGRI